MRLGSPTAGEQTLPYMTLTPMLGNPCRLSGKDLNRLLYPLGIQLPPR
jgi:hypothetical protein